MDRSGSSCPVPALWHSFRLRVGEAGMPVPVVSLPARGRPPQAAARRVGLEGVEKSLPAPSPVRTRRSGTPRHASRPAPSHRWSSWLVVLAPRRPGRRRRTRFPGSSSAGPYDVQPSGGAGTAGPVSGAFWERIGGPTVGAPWRTPIWSSTLGSGGPVGGGGPWPAATPGHPLRADRHPERK
jgi:hypothetical protein